MTVQLGAWPKTEQLTNLSTFRVRKGIKFTKIFVEEQPELSKSTFQLGTWPKTEQLTNLSTFAKRQQQSGALRL